MNFSHIPILMPHLRETVFYRQRHFFDGGGHKTRPIRLRCHSVCAYKYGA